MEKERLPEPIRVRASDLQQIGSLVPSTGQVANEQADQTAYRRYSESKSANTIRRQRADLILFSHYLQESHYEYPFDQFFPLLDEGRTRDAWSLWQGITYGLVEGFVEWMKQQGYAIGSIGVRLSTVKRYCAFAQRAGVIDQTDLAMIMMIKGPTHKEGIHIDRKRTIAQTKTRVGEKKTTPTHISPAHAVLLKQQRRPKDAAMLCILLDLGLRVGELVGLKVSNINLSEATITFYREKVDKTQTHHLTPDCLVALKVYLPQVKGSYLFPGYTPDKPMRTSAVNKQVGILGQRIGIEDLSPHDCRHFLLTQEAKKGTDIKTLQLIGGWSSPAMALRYVADASIANEGASFFR